MRISWLVLAAWCAIGATPSGAADPPRPNVLWICGDDLAPYVCGAYGNARVRTPNIDRLAAEGIRFDRAFCNSPVCTASRQSFLTGRYPRTIGVTLLKTALPASEVTLAERLKQTGYDTAAIGKMHFNSELPHGFDLRVDQREHRQWLARRGAQPVPEDIDALPAWKPFRDPARIWLNSSCRPFAALDADMAGTFFAHEAARFIETERDRPFFLMASFYEPHSPFHFPVEFRGRHKPESFDVPKVGPQDDWQIPGIFRDLSDAEKQGIIAAYHTSVEFLDKNVGLVLDALRRSDKDRDTLVILIGDHGYMLGQHGRFEKHCSYEPAVRSPLVLRFPGQIKPGQSTKALTEFIDIAPTVLEFCGEQVPPSLQGKSLRPLLRGEKRQHRNHVVVEYSENAEAMIRTERWKLVVITGQRERQDGYATGRPLAGRKILLFDLDNDPDELTNLADQPEHADRVAELASRLATHMRQTARQPELVPRDPDVFSTLDFCLEPRDVGPPTSP